MSTKRTPEKASGTPTADEKPSVSADMLGEARSGEILDDFPTDRPTRDIWVARALIDDLTSLHIFAKKTSSPSAPEWSVGFSESVNVNRKTKTRSKKPSADSLTVPIPASLNTDAFKDALDKWIQHLKKIKEPITVTSITKQLDNLKVAGSVWAVTSIEDSIADGSVEIRDSFSRRCAGSMFNRVNCYMKTLSEMLTTGYDQLASRFYEPTGVMVGAWRETCVAKIAYLVGWQLRKEIAFAGILAGIKEEITVQTDIAFHPINPFSPHSIEGLQKWAGETPRDSLKQLDIAMLAEHRKAAALSTNTDVHDINPVGALKGTPGRKSSPIKHQHACFANELRRDFSDLTWKEVAKKVNVEFQLTEADGYTDEKIRLLHQDIILRPERKKKRG